MKLSEQEVEALLKDGLVEPPPDFVARVVLQIETESGPPIAASQTTFVYYLFSALRYLVLLTGAAVGVSQFTRLFFGVWLIAAAN